jgi:hypothetical protein
MQRHSELSGENIPGFEADVDPSHVAEMQFDEVEGGVYKFF